MEYISSKSKLKISSDFPQFLPQIILILLEGADIHFLSGQCSLKPCIHQEWAFGRQSRVLQRLDLGYVCSPIWERKRMKSIKI